MRASLNILYVGNDINSLGKFRHQDEISLTVFDNNLCAINYLNTNKEPDAIICDFNLPGNNGLFLFEWIRDRAIYNRTPFVLLEHEFNSDNFKLAFKKQVDDYFVSSTSLPKGFFNRIQYLYDFRNKPSNSEKVITGEEVYKIPLSKRIFDIVLASIVLLFAAPFLLLIILAIRIESKGKVYYTAKRVGRKTFDFYKLRSMRTGSDELLKNLAKEKNQYNTVSKSIDQELEST